MPASPENTPSNASTSASASTAASSTATGSQGPVATVPETIDGKQVATGTVVTTTVKDRAGEIGQTGDDWDSTDLLTILELDNPIKVKAYYGGSEDTVEATSICLPNDEMFRQFSGKEITIGVNSWGEKPADIMGMLYDLKLDFNTDGLVLIEPKS